VTDFYKHNTGPLKYWITFHCHCLKR